MALLLRFYEIQRGDILLDGIDIRDINVKSLRDQLALVSQEPLLFNSSIAENISYGRSVTNVKDIEKVADAALVSEFVRKESHLFDVCVGPGGSQLSAG